MDLPEENESSFEEKLLTADAIGSALLLVFDVGLWLRLCMRLLRMAGLFCGRLRDFCLWTLNKRINKKYFNAKSRGKPRPF